MSPGGTVVYDRLGGSLLSNACAKGAAMKRRRAIAAKRRFIVMEVV